MSLSEIIASRVYKLYESLGKTGKPKEGEEWTHLAAFVFIDVTVVKGEGSSSDDGIRVVSLATGTKCIGSKSLSVEGKVVSDSHAEVLARRALLQSLYDEIETAQTNGASFLFPRRSPRGKWEINQNLGLYLFTSHVPCGDASIIPFEHTSTGPSDSGESPRKKFKLDVHRTGAKPVTTDLRQDPKGEGREYHCRGAVRIKPGRGDPTKSLSCSDKIARWIECGCEGALLSTLIEGPLRIRGIIVAGGAQFDEKIMAEALVVRSKTEHSPIFMNCPIPFRQSPKITGASRPCAQSLIWSDVKTKKLEVSVEGKKLGATKKALGQSLQICKRNLFQKFLDLTPVAFNQGTTYRQAKNSALDYRSFSDKFKTNMGAWSEDKSQWEMFSIK